MNNVEENATVKEDFNNPHFARINNKHCSFKFLGDMTQEDLGEIIKLFHNDKKHHLIKRMLEKTTVKNIPKLVGSLTGFFKTLYENYGSKRKEFIKGMKKYLVTYDGEDLTVYKDEQSTLDFNVTHIGDYGDPFNECDSDINVLFLINSNLEVGCVTGFNLMENVDLNLTFLSNVLYAATEGRIIFDIGNHVHSIINSVLINSKIYSFSSNYEGVRTKRIINSGIGDSSLDSEELFISNTNLFNVALKGGRIVCENSNLENKEIRTTAKITFSTERKTDGQTSLKDKDIFNLNLDDFNNGENSKNDIVCERNIDFGKIKIGHFDYQFIKTVNELGEPSLCLTEGPTKFNGMLRHYQTHHFVLREVRFVHIPFTRSRSGIGEEVRGLLRLDGKNTTDIDEIIVDTLSDFIHSRIKLIMLTERMISYNL